MYEYENDISINDSNYEILDYNESNTMKNTSINDLSKNEKSKQMDDDYTRLIQERGNDMFNK